MTEFIDVLDLHGAAPHAGDKHFEVPPDPFGHIPDMMPPSLVHVAPDGVTQNVTALVDKETGEVIAPDSDRAAFGVAMRGFTVNGEFIPYQEPEELTQSIAMVNAVAIAAARMGGQKVEALLQEAPNFNADDSAEPDSTGFMAGIRRFIIKKVGHGNPASLFIVGTAMSLFTNIVTPHLSQGAEHAEPQAQPDPSHTHTGPTGNHDVDALLWGQDIARERGMSFASDGKLGTAAHNIPYTYNTGYAEQMLAEHSEDAATLNPKNVTPATPLQQAMHEKAFYEFSGVVDVSFEKVSTITSDQPQGISVVGATELTRAAGFAPAYSDSAHPNQTQHAISAIHNDLSKHGGDNVGMNQTVTHEVGHSLGLSHTHDGSDDTTVKNTTEPVIAGEKDNKTLSTMSYKDGPTKPVGLQVMDMHALRELYGANMHHNTGSTTYALTEMSFDDILASRDDTKVPEGYSSARWDAGGDRDKVSTTAHDGDVRADLREGADHVTRSTDNKTMLRFAEGSNIEDLETGKGNDIAHGNELDNIISTGDGQDVLRGDAGNDRLDDGTGHGVYMFGAHHGNDVLPNFNPAEDIIQIEKDVARVGLSVENGNSVLTLIDRDGHESTVTMQGVELKSLSDIHMINDDGAGLGAGKGDALVVHGLTGDKTIDSLPGNTVQAGWGVEKISITEFPDGSAKLYLQDNNGDSLSEITVKNFSDRDVKTLHFVDESGQQLAEDQISKTRHVVLEHHKSGFWDLFSGALSHNETVRDFDPQQDRIMLGASAEMVDIAEKDGNTVLRLMNGSGKIIERLTLEGVNISDWSDLTFSDTKGNDIPLEKMVGRITSVEGYIERPFMGQEMHVVTDDKADRNYDFGKDPTSYRDNDGRDIVRGGGDGSMIEDGKGWDVYIRGGGSREYTLNNPDGANIIDTFDVKEDKFSVTNLDLSVAVLRLGDTGSAVITTHDASNGHFSEFNIGTAQNGEVDDIRITQGNGDPYDNIKHGFHVSPGMQEQTLSHFDPTKHVLNFAVDVDHIDVASEKGGTFVECFDKDGNTVAKVMLENVHIGSPDEIRLTHSVNGKIEQFDTEKVSAVKGTGSADRKLFDGTPGGEEISARETKEAFVYDGGGSDRVIGGDKTMFMVGEGDNTFTRGGKQTFVMESTVADHPIHNGQNVIDRFQTSEDTFIVNQKTQLVGITPLGGQRAAIEIVEGQNKVTFIIEHLEGSVNDIKIQGYGGKEVTPTITSSTPLPGHVQNTDLQDLVGGLGNALTSLGVQSSTSHMPDTLPPAIHTGEAKEYASWASKVSGHSNGDRALH